MANVLCNRHGVYELLQCLGKNIPAINAVECVFASQLPSVAVVPTNFIIKDSMSLPTCVKLSFSCSLLFLICIDATKTLHYYTVSQKKLDCYD